MNSRGLCQNPECGAFFDQPPVPHLDRETGKVILMCQNCTRSCAENLDSRYVEMESATPTEKR